MPWLLIDTFSALNRRLALLLVWLLLPWPARRAFPRAPAEHRGNLPFDPGVAEDEATVDGSTNALQKVVTQRVGK